MSIQEAWDEFEFRQGDEGYAKAARNLALAVHVDACVLTEFGHACGGETGWYCDKAQEIERLGKEGSDE